MAFFAKRLHDQNPEYGSPLVFFEVSTNLGDGYNNTSGYFTAPYNGTYFFVVTCGSVDNDDYANYNLYLDDDKINHVFMYNHNGHIYFSTLHGSAHLGVGQTVWVRSNGAGYHSYSSFSGFLISEDS